MTIEINKFQQKSDEQRFYDLCTQLSGEVGPINGGVVDIACGVADPRKGVNKYLREQGFTGPFTYVGFDITSLPYKDLQLYARGMDVYKPDAVTIPNEGTLLFGGKVAGDILRSERPQGEEIVRAPGIEEYLSTCRPEDIGFFLMRHPDVKGGQDLFETIIAKSLEYASDFEKPLVITTSNPISLLMIHRMLMNASAGVSLFGANSSPVNVVGNQIEHENCEDMTLLKRLHDDIDGSLPYLEEAQETAERSFESDTYIEHMCTLAELHEKLPEVLNWNTNIKGRDVRVKTIDTFEHSERFDMYGQCPDKHNDRYTILVKF